MPGTTVSPTRTGRLATTPSSGAYALERSTSEARVGAIGALLPNAFLGGAELRSHLRPLRPGLYETRHLAQGRLLGIVG